MKTKKLAYSALLAAVGIILGNIIYIPVGASKCFPVQHLINVVSAVILGPFNGVAVAFVISLVRNMLGTGTLLAFPGSMIGALLAGLIFKYTKKDYLAVLAEIIGTGIIGGIVAYPVAAYILGKNAAVFAYVLPFFISTTGGSIIAFIILRALKASKLFNKTIEA
jgi:energy coupling factor transporter S component ThiW